MPALGIKGGKAEQTVPARRGSGRRHGLTSECPTASRGRTTVKLQGTRPEGIGCWRTLRVSPAAARPQEDNDGNRNAACRHGFLHAPGGSSAALAGPPEKGEKGSVPASPASTALRRLRRQRY